MDTDRYVGLYRPTRRSRWRRVASGATEEEVWDKLLKFSTMDPRAEKWVTKIENEPISTIQGGKDGS
jgi:hypothetical protein